MDRQKWTLLRSAGVGAGLGAGLMYLLDPQGGRGRRTVAKTKATSALTKGGDAVKKTTRDLGNRTKGLVAGAGSRLRRGEVSDNVVRDRVRSKLGHAISHASALEVLVSEGRVTLTGPVLALEADRLLDAVRSVKGVKDVECRFDLQEGSVDLSALQGNGGAASGSRNWKPAASRVLAGTAGAGLAVAGYKKKGALGIALGTLAVGLLAGGVSGKSGAGKLAGLVRRRGDRANSSDDKILAEIAPLSS
jgi:hypothetical protein